MLILHSTGKFYFIWDRVKIFLEFFFKLQKKNAGKHFFLGVSKNFRKWFTSPVVRSSNGLRVMYEWLYVKTLCFLTTVTNEFELGKSSRFNRPIYGKPSHKHWPWYGLWSCFSWILRFCENRYDHESNHNYLVWNLTVMLTWIEILTIIWFRLAAEFMMLLYVFLIFFLMTFFLISQQIDSPPFFLSIPPLYNLNVLIGWFYLNMCIVPIL